MSNPMFDDFIELDLLDASDPANAMFASFYLGDTADIDGSDYNVDNSNLAPAVAAVDPLPIPVVATTASDSTESSSLGLVIKQEPSDSPMLLNPIPLSPQQTLASDESPLIFDTDMTMITPDQLTIAPQATTVSPSSLSSSSSSTPATTVSTAAAAIASATTTTATTTTTTATQSTVAIDSSKILASTATSPSTANTSSSSPSPSPAPAASTSTAKRASPEPATTPARKHAKTESISSSTSSKAKSSSASKKSSSSASTTSNAAAATKASSGASKSAASTSTSTTSSSSTASKGKTQTPESTPESLTSTANTTLSAATLQFLLQQQVETPLIPQLFTGKLSREEIEETLARLLESTKHLIPTPDEEAPVKVKEEPASEDESDNEMEGVEPTTAEGAEPSHGLKTQPGIKTDDIPSSTDLKKMTSKERRQLRNKISARNFRVRRKEYIYTLEGQVLQHKTEARHLREAVTLMQDENQRLKDELETVRRQLEATTLSSSSINPATIAATSIDPTLAPEPSMPLSKENQSLLTSIMNRNVTAAMNPNAKSNITLSMARPQSPILTPNLHKDVPNSSSGSSSQSSWKDKNPIMVHRTLVPEICFGDEFQFDNKPSGSLDANTMDRPWMTFDPKPAEPQMSSVYSFTVSDFVLELMQTFTRMSANLPSTTAVAVEESVVEVDAEAEADLDWELQQNLWALTQVEEEDDMTEDQIQLVYDLVQCQASSSRPSSPAQEDPNMLEWLYESMMARLVDLDLQGSQDNTLPESHMA
ncbi:hypothetical protein BG015_008599 [Linnemannia schmuckeri]|uniref:BZIP domain-containing protein n=1 Tax=Linnemannia schmuckeri TaxID=64567 RepID=A0A9P5S6D8_9FUNG|nr:hypothetical protein BG015_008599 [Linnemannia schmuckeri]